MWKFSTILVFIFSSAATAAPNITGFRLADNLLSNGTTVVLLGTGFGTKSQARPLIYDDFETGAIGSAWTNANDLGVGRVNQRHSRSVWCSTLNFTGSAYDGMLAGGTNQAKWFVSYWFRIDSDYDWGTLTQPSADQFLTNVKFLRWWDTGSDLGNVFVQFGYPGLNADSYVQNEGIDDDTWYFDLTRNKISKGGWHQVQAEFADGTVGGNDGTVRIWYDGAIKFSSTTIKTRNAGSQNNKRPQVLGFDNAWGPGGGESDQDPNTFYLDDAYIDTSWQRVELSSSNTYTGSPRELQITTAWADRSIGFIVEKGMLPENVPIYVYVTDNSGNQSPAKQIDKPEVCPCR